MFVSHVSMQCPEWKRGRLNISGTGWLGPIGRSRIPLKSPAEWFKLDTLFCRTTSTEYGVKPFNREHQAMPPTREASAPSIGVEPGSKRNFRIGLAGPFLDPIRLHLEVNTQGSAKGPEDAQVGDWERGKNELGYGIVPFRAPPMYPAWS